MAISKKLLEKVIIFASSILDKPIYSIEEDEAFVLLRSLEDCEVEYRCDREHRTPLKASELENAVAVIADLEVYDENILKEIGIGGKGNVRLISRYGVGVDSIDLDAATKYGVMVTNCPGCNSLPVAEWTLSTILDVAGKRIHNHELASAGKTKENSSRQDISGKVMGVIGTGNAGKEIVKIMSGFGVKVIAYTPNPNLDWKRNNGVTYYDNPKDIYKSADIITLHATLQDRRPLIGENEIRMMKPTAILINCARDYLVDEIAVYNAVKEGRLFGYGVDDCWMRKDLPIKGLNIVTSPHVGSDSDLGKKGMRNISTQAVADLFSRKIPRYVVNKEVLSHEKWEGYVQ